MRTILLLLLLLALPARAAEITVLSAGAVEPGLAAAAASFRTETGHAVSLRFATAPALRRLLAEGATADLLVAPPAVLRDHPTLLASQPVPLGRVGVGVAIRPGAPRPDISDTAAFTRSLQAADRLVFNRASTGLYMEQLLSRLGLAALPTVRYPDGAAVMEHLLAGSGAEIGFGAMTEILLFRDRGLVLVGPLPAGVQNTTDYAATLLAAGSRSPEAAALLRWLAGPEGRAAFTAAGILP